MWDNVGFWSRHAKVCPRIALAFLAVLSLFVWPCCGIVVHASLAECLC